MSKHPKTFRVLFLFLALSLTFYMNSCNNSDEKKTESASSTKTMSKEEMIKRGDYIVTTGSCNDCHTPKLFPQGRMILDSTKLLSGHPASSQLPPVNEKSLQPGQWMSLAPDLTAFVGPWGVSYSANLTPDSTTGMGAWSESTFINTMRTGRHLGDANGRPVLPPMPWEFIGKLTDDDLKSVYDYLESLPAINNKVPAPVSPPDAMKMTAGK